MNKKEPWSDTIELTSDKKKLENGFIVLVDDVLNSGKTMQYALIELLQFPTKAIKTVVLVDRKHRRFPIKADFVGLSLSTTLKERVEVNLEKKPAKSLSGMIDRITESSSNFDDLDKMSTSELLHGINSEDSTVSAAVKRIIPSIEQFVDACYERMSLKRQVVLHRCRNQWTTWHC